MMMVKASARTDIGRVRNRNEDSFLIDRGASLYAVADGMGGHAAGDVASQTAIAAFAAAFHERRDILAAARSANRAVLERAQAEPEKSGMGTTLTGIELKARSMSVVHVGDTRLYRLRADELVQLTHDHTVAQDMVDSGTLSKEAAMQHPAGSMLKRALGLRPEVEIDVFEEELVAHDLLLLCSDGLSGMLTDHDIQQILSVGHDLDARAEQLILHAYRRGGLDNITAILLQVENG
jgi:protein phosphatase